MKKKLLCSIVAGILTASMITGCSATLTAPTTSADAVVEEAAEEPAAEEEAAPVEEEVAEEPEAAGAEVIVLYTNDVHSHIDNFNNEDDGEEEVSKLSYASIAAYKKELQAQGKNVVMLDAGDAVQGTAYGSLDEGASIIDLMNAAGYDLATVGNHEFDYGMFRMFELTDNAVFPYVSCNFHYITDDNTAFDPYKVFDFDGYKVAFVGISTPDSISSSSPKYFMNEKGEFIYDFYNSDGGDELAAKFQEAIDAASAEADLVIGFGHLGDDMSSSPFTSTEIIPKISGIAAFIDGHSHSVNEGMTIQDANGNDVIITQTGTAFGSFGEMTIAADGTISTKLITDYEGVDDEVRAMETAVIDNVNEQLGEKIADIQTDFYIMNPKDDTERLIRNQETNLGDYVADALYYYFNNVAEEPVDVAFSNGGGIRANVPAGEMDYFVAKTVEPFGNFGCVVEMTGQQLLDALEFGANLIGQTNEETGKPAEFGGFLQVAGMKFDIDSSIECSVAMDDNGIWTAGPSGDYKVSNLQIYNKDTNAYEDVDLAKNYRVGGISYTLCNLGDGFAMFDGCTVVADNVCEDYLIFAEYAKSFAQINDVPTIATDYSPLSALKGYLIDYENPAGSGRITIK